MTLATEHEHWQERRERRKAVERIHAEGAEGRITLTVTATDPEDTDAVALASAMQTHVVRLLAELTAQVVLAARKAERQAADAVKTRLAQDYPEIGD